MEATGRLRSSSGYRERTRARARCGCLGCSAPANPVTDFDTTLLSKTVASCYGSFSRMDSSASETARPMPAEICKWTFRTSSRRAHSRCPGSTVSIFELNSSILLMRSATLFRSGLSSKTIALPADRSAPDTPMIIRCRGRKALSIFWRSVIADKILRTSTFRSHAALYFFPYLDAPSHEIADLVVLHRCRFKVEAFIIFVVERLMRCSRSGLTHFQKCTRRHWRHYQIAVSA